MHSNQLYIVTGGQGAGKTTFLTKVIDILVSQKVRVGGFIAKGIWKDDKRYGFNLLSIQDGICIPLCTKEPLEDYVQFGHFFFNPAALKFGNEIIARDNNHTDIMIIDEIGIFELEEKIWFEAFNQLLKTTSMPVLISVRKKIVQQVIEKFNLSRVEVIQAVDRDDKTAEAIISGFNN